MIQEVIISGNTEIPIKPLIESAVRSELRMLELAVQRTGERLCAFEKKYDIATDEFRIRFENGEITESLDFIEWLGEIRTAEILKAQKHALEGVNFAD
ncbi:MAG: hypothetical protein GY749_01030 [Desulfobacteraceae bacterium]|nr:hypothetical protein [Desulfobacteraceae bacterium]